MTHSADETVAFGRTLARDLEPPCLVLLEGELGSGKTTLTKGLLAGLGVAREDEVTSPSFTIVHEYGREKKAYHIDLYRVDTPQELATLGLEELLSQSAILIIEWGEKLGEDFSSHRYIRIRMEHVTGEKRRIQVNRPSS